MTTPPEANPTRVLFLCTKNSARSQMAEALLAELGGARFEVASAGASPAMEVDLMTFEVLDELGIDWRSHRTKGYATILGTAWDVVITVCDRARESCPVLPGHPVYAHWSIEDPVECSGTSWARRAVFRSTAARLRDSISQLVQLPPAELRTERLNACLKDDN